LRSMAPRLQTVQETVWTHLARELLCCSIQPSSETTPEHALASVSKKPSSSMGCSLIGQFWATSENAYSPEGAADALHHGKWGGLLTHKVLTGIKMPKERPSADDSFKCQKCSGDNFDIKECTLIERFIIFVTRKQKYRCSNCGHRFRHRRDSHSAPMDELTKHGESHSGNPPRQHAADRDFDSPAQPFSSIGRVPFDVFGELLISVGQSILRNIVLAVLERKFARANLRLELLRDGVEGHSFFTVDGTGSVTSWNRGAERMYGHREREVVGQHFSRFFTPEDTQTGSPLPRRPRSAARYRRYPAICCNRQFTTVGQSTRTGRSAKTAHAFSPKAC
jgi:PAS domain-containing protein